MTTTLQVQINLSILTNNHKANFQNKQSKRFLNFSSSIRKCSKGLS